MQPLLYHDHPGTTAHGGRRGALRLPAATVIALTLACGRPPAPSVTAGTTPPAPTRGGGTATPGAAASSPTADAIAKGRAIIDKVRAAAGGAVVTGLQGLRASGRSQLSAMRVPRRLRIDVRLPGWYRQEESMTGSGFNTVFGLEDGKGYLVGANLGGEGQSKDLATAQQARTRAARQAMAAFLAGVCPSCLIDTGTVTPTSDGTVLAGDDKDAVIVRLDGPEGRIGRVIIDPDTWLVRRLIQPPQPSTGGVSARTDVTFTFSDYRAVGGMQVPHTIVREAGALRAVWTIDSWSLNPPFVASQFSPTGR